MAVGGGLSVEFRERVFDSVEPVAEFLVLLALVGLDQEGCVVGGDDTEQPNADEGPTASCEERVRVERPTMTKRRATAGTDDPQADLFSIDPTSYVPIRLSERAWPSQDRFPVNHARANVSQPVRDDLVSATDPIVVAGFSSVDEFISLAATWSRVHPDGGRLRLVLGTEPFTTGRTSFVSAEASFTDEVRRYWVEERGISLRLSAKIVRAIDLLDEGSIASRFVHGRTHLHAKIYVGDGAATVGSSNFTASGLRFQIEANARFDRSTDPERYDELVLVAENLWSEGEDWNAQFRALLVSLLQVVSWQEALARASADLLEGEWADRYLVNDAAGRQLWPSQRLGIAQALWITERVGSVLVADATGSGKTRMGAHLVRAVHDRLWSTGRVRRGGTVLVCPPPVQATWFEEAVKCGLNIATISHGLLSRGATDGPRPEAEAVRSAQILAVDESHNFLSPGTKRSQQVRSSVADSVLLFTATPINRDASDLLQLVGLLGADNFDDDTLAVLDRLDRRRGAAPTMTASESSQLRREIAKFTVRRTKSALNDLVDEEPGAYAHPDTGRICRYPRHDAQRYATGETPADERHALRVRELLVSIRGLAQLERTVAVPAALRSEYSDERWLQTRLTASKGLSAHRVSSAMRSSKAALLEHLVGTAQASSEIGVDPSFKAKPTGDVLGRLLALRDEGPPELTLTCDLPDFLTDAAAWRHACEAEHRIYSEILDEARALSSAREQAKADLLRQLADRHERVLAFDRHLITLSAIKPLLDRASARVVVATGADAKARKSVSRLFARDSLESAIALCSDAMNEGLNLQGASAIVHLDLPTTLRVAEQRVGRVDRMDSPYDVIEAWWPDDGAAFATRANELLAERAAESSALLGSNLPVPGVANDVIVDVGEEIERFEAAAETWDGIHDALDPVRQLVQGPTAIVPAVVYREYRRSSHRVLARVSTVAAEQPWAFFAVSGTQHGAPRWMLLDDRSQVPIVELDEVADRLRSRLGADPRRLPFDDHAEAVLDRFLTAAARAERAMLPRRMQRALEQMALLTASWAKSADRTGENETAQQWRALRKLAIDDDTTERPDGYLVAQAWLDLVAPALEEERAARRRARYVLLRHADDRLRNSPLDLGVVQEAMSRLPIASPLDQRISACILGIPTP
jgi:hypothetical protein